MDTLTVGEAARQTGVSIDTLRYYERENLLLAQRTSSGHRRYSDGDLGWIRILTCLRDTGMPIRKMREFALLVRQDGGNIPERVRLLECHRETVLEHISDLERNLAYVENKIRHYQDEINRNA